MQHTREELMDMSREELIKLVMECEEDREMRWADHGLLVESLRSVYRMIGQIVDSYGEK